MKHVITFSLLNDWFNSLGSRALEVKKKTVLGAFKLWGVKEPSKTDVQPENFMPLFIDTYVYNDAYKSDIPAGQIRCRIPLRTHPERVLIRYYLR